MTVGKAADTVGNPVATVVSAAGTVVVGANTVGNVRTRLSFQQTQLSFLARRGRIGAERVPDRSSGFARSVRPSWHFVGCRPVPDLRESITAEIQGHSGIEGILVPGQLLEAVELPGIIGEDQFPEFRFRLVLACTKLLQADDERPYLLRKLRVERNDGLVDVVAAETNCYLGT